MWEDNFDDHVVEFKKLLLGASAESGYVLNCLNSRNSLICHPSMHASSFARVFDGKSGGVSGMVCGEGVGRGLRGRDTARLDVSLHNAIRLVPACGNPRIRGIPEYFDCSHARWSTSSNSRPERGPELREGTKWSSLCKARQDFGKKLAFPQQLPGKMHVETWAGGCKSLNLKTSQEQEIKGRCAVAGFLLGLLLAVTFG